MMEIIYVIIKVMMRVYNPLMASILEQAAMKNTLDLTQSSYI